MSFQDRARGALIGAVLGDAFGAPFEGASPAAALRIAEQRAARPSRWGYTDDAAMFIAVAESIRDRGEVEPHSLLSAMLRRYEPARGFGRGMKLALRAFEAGTDWREVGRVAWPEGSRGNGGAVRAGAVALCRWSTIDELIEAVRLATSITHAHPEAIEMAMMHARLVALVLEDPAVATASAIDQLERDLPPSAFLTDILARLRVDAPTSFGTSTLACESVPAAAAVFLRGHASFQEAITAAAALGGDVDSICTLVGCLAGAAHGLSGIPTSWIAAIEHESPSPEELVALADALCEGGDPDAS